MIANIHLECSLRVNQCMYRISLHPNSSGLIPGTIQRVTGPVSYTVMLSNGSIVKRHVDNIKARHTKNTSEESINETPSDNSLPETVSPVTSTTDDTAEPELVIFNETKQNETTP